MGAVLRLCVRRPPLPPPRPEPSQTNFPSGDDGSEGSSTETLEMALSDLLVALDTVDATSSGPR
eukprot:2174447-Alexandrium_andersonii.AAC.1